MKAPLKAEHWEMDNSEPVQDTWSRRIGRVELGNELLSSTSTPTPGLRQLLLDSL